MGKPRLGVLKLTSCSGCINEIIYAISKDSALLDTFEIHYFTELIDVREIPDRLDLLLVEGSISTEEQLEFIKKFRSISSFVVAIGTCASLGGVQSLRVSKDIAEVKSYIYQRPEYIDVYSDVKPLSDVINIDFIFYGCPINGNALLQFLKKFARGGLPINVVESVCAECKRKGILCVMVLKNVPCLGSVTNGGCGAICPSYGRGCYGCYGLKPVDVSKDTIEVVLSRLSELGMGFDHVLTLMKGYGFGVYRKYMGVGP